MYGFSTYAQSHAIICLFFVAVPGCFLFLILACRAKKTACNRVGQNAGPGGEFGGSFFAFVLVLDIIRSRY